MRNKYKNFALSLLCGGSLFVGAANVASAQNNGNPVDLQADRLIHDDNLQTVTAVGEVVLVQNGKTVKADKIVYNLQNDTVIATGDVMFSDVNGDKHYADRVEFNNALKDGFTEGLKTFLADGSRFRASNAHHIQGNQTTMKDVFYTPCEPCEKDPSAAPIWQIRASEVEHDKENKTVSYRNARFEIAGVPVAYMPYFEHPDGTVERKSGFLTPSAGYTSELGAFVESSYYWSIAPDKDLTAGLMVMTDEVPLGLLEWRQRWENASLKAKGTFTYSSRTDEQSGSNIVTDDEWRGSLDLDYLWDINNKWRAGAEIDVSSDDQYLRQYDLDSEDILHSELYLERFSGRNYAAGRLIGFQDVRIAEDRQDQPHILPEIEGIFFGEPDSIPFIGGRWSAGASLLGLVRDDDQQDVNRLHAELGWNRKLISDYGFVTVLDAMAQATFYDVNDRTGSTNSNVVDGNSREARSHAYLNTKVSYPVSKQLEHSQIVLEPVVALKVSPRLNDFDDYPNEDSQDVQLDTMNVLNPTRFPGIDGVEDGSHATYGLRSGIYADDQSYANAFIGQSYRFNDKANPFPQGSGLEEQSSDFVGQISGNYKNDYTLDYRFQMDESNFASQRHEVDASLRIQNLKLDTQYLYAKGLVGTDVDETREQITNSASYYINDKWRLYGDARHDLGVDSGLRTAGLGIDYTGQCVSLSVIGRRNLTDEASGDSGTEVFLRIGFKNLGSLQTSAVQISGQNE